MSFKIVTDNTADLPKEILDQNQISVMTLPYTIEGATYDGEHPLDVKEFYIKMRNGSMPTTSQVNPDEAKKAFERYILDYKEILYISFSSGLSGTYNSVSLAASEVMEENPGVKIEVIDTKCASLGEGLVVYMASNFRNQGRSFEETIEYVKSMSGHVIHIFTVDDLYHLYRGGRVSKTTAFIGTLANIKPILHVDNDGKLIPIGKVRGRKKSIHELADYMETKMGSYKSENKIVFISHGDCIDDIELLKEEITKRYGIDQFVINEVGATIGAHSGPGTIALFFLGDKR